MSLNTPEGILKSLGFDLNKIPIITPKALYVAAVRTGNLIHLAGHVPYKIGTMELLEGKVGKEYTIEEAQKIAEVIAVSLLKTVQVNIGSLLKVERIVKVNGFVNCGPEFTQHSMVINGASELLLKVFGNERGLHARTAVGAPSLPFNGTTPLNETNPWDSSRGDRYDRPG